MSSRMIRQPNRSRNVEDIPSPLLLRLNNYGLAATAAGVAMLACSAPAEAAPICKTVSINFARTASYQFNPAAQRVTPFTIAQTYNEISSMSHSVHIRGFFTPNTPSANAVLSTNGFPADLPAGALIGPNAQFGKGKSYGEFFQFRYFQGLTGPFASAQPGYAGFEFSQAGETHYGWIRMRVIVRQFNYPQLLVSEYGYESSPNTSIAAGSCAGSGSSAESSSPSETVLAMKEKRASTLGALALGSQGLALWRRETESAEFSAPNLTRRPL